MGGRGLGPGTNHRPPPAPASAVVEAGAGGGLFQLQSVSAGPADTAQRHPALDVRIRRARK